MSANYSNKATFRGVLETGNTGTLIGFVIQKNGIIRVNKSYTTKKSAKAIAKAKNSI